MDTDTRPPEELLAKAEKTLTAWGIFNGRSKRDAACRLFNAAAQSFKLAKNWHAAGAAFVRLAETKKEMRFNLEAAQAYRSAVDAFIKAGTCDERAERIAVDHTIPYLLEAGRHLAIGQLLSEIGEMFDHHNNVPQALHYYAKAADLLKEYSDSAAETCFRKFAALSAMASHYGDAVQAFETAGNICLKTDLLKYNAKRAFLNAILSVLASGDVTLAARKQREYLALDLTLKNSREGDFVERLLKASNDSDVDAFTAVANDFDRVVTLTPFQTLMLHRAKLTLEDPGLL